MLKVTWKWLNFERFSSLALITGLAAAFFFLFFWRLGSLTPGLSSAENLARASSQSFELIAKNPLFAPHKVLQLGLQSLELDSAFWLRLPSALAALVFIYLFYRLSRLWFGRYIGAMGAILFASTPLVILLGRSATPSVLWLIPILPLAVYVWLIKSQDKTWLKWILFCLAVGACAYVPGVLWIIGLWLVVDTRRLRQSLTAISLPKIFVGFLVFAAAVSPLFWSLIQDPSLIKPLLLIPPYWAGVGTVAAAFFWSLASIVWRTQQHYELIIDRLPLFNILQIALFVFGVYVLWSRVRRQLALLASPVLIGILAATVNRNMVLLTLGVPSFVLAATAGLRYLYMEWRGIFPRNPLPKTLAIFVLSFVVLLSLAIGIRYSLIAWPNTLATENEYVIQ